VERSEVHLFEQVGQRCERELRLCLARPGRQDEVAPPSRLVDARLPQRRLPDARLADEEQPARLGVVEERVDAGDLGFSTEYLPALSSSRRGFDPQTAWIPNVGSRGKRAGDSSRRPARRKG